MANRLPFVLNHLLIQKDIYEDGNVRVLPEEPNFQQLTNPAKLNFTWYFHSVRLPLR
jgi:hypothetical protein